MTGRPDESTNIFRQLQSASYLKPEWLPLYVRWGSNRFYMGRPRGVWNDQHGKQGLVHHSAGSGIGASRLETGQCPLSDAKITLTSVAIFAILPLQGTRTRGALNRGAEARGPRETPHAGADRARRGDAGAPGPSPRVPSSPFCHITASDPSGSAGHLPI